MPKIKLTDAYVERLRHAPTGKQRIYYDTDTKGLAVRVTAGSKVFVFERWVGGRTVRQKIEDCSVLSVAAARKAVERIATTAAVTGVDPAQQKRNDVAANARGVTFGEVAKRYLDTRKLAERTRRDYQGLLDDHLAGIADTPVDRLTGDAMIELHKRLSKRSPRRANYALVFARAVINLVVDDLDIRNPVRALTREKGWNREGRRSGYLKIGDVTTFWQATETPPGPRHIRSKASRDYLRFILLTGTRRGEAAQLEWRDVDLAGKTFTVRDTKNREPHTLPLTDYLLELLAATPRSERSGRVFPRTDDPRKTVDAIAATVGYPLTIHDLRRSFATYGDALRLSPYIVKRLLNHKVRDVTGAHYVQTDIERLREPIQQITDYVLKAAGIKPSADVVELPQRSRQ